MKSEAAKQFEDLLRDARTLADFSNLNDADADYFRKNYPDFVPEAWWEVETEVHQRLWKRTQENFRETWQAGFPLEKSVRLIISGGAIPHWLLWDDPIAQLEQLEQIWPYQRAVMFLVTSPWRAKHCTICLKRFVAAEPKQGVCSEQCRQEAERRRKRNWWSRSGKRWRNSKQGESKSKSKR